MGGDPVGRLRKRRRGALTAFVVALGMFCTAVVRSGAEPFIPGLVTGTLEPELRGQVLIEELNCVACHASEGSLKARSKQA
ncbi:MAG: hypothetical protein RLZZ265_834, partial [Verrucomicrobiota bacterium]